MIYADVFIQVSGVIILSVIGDRGDRQSAIFEHVGAYTRTVATFENGSDNQNRRITVPTAVLLYMRLLCM